MGSQKYSHGKAHLCRESLIRNPRWLPQLLQSFLLGFYNPQYDDVTSVWYLSQATLVISQSFLLIHHCRLLFEWSLTICCFSLSVPSYLILYSCLWCWEHNRKVSEPTDLQRNQECSAHRIVFPGMINNLLFHLQSLELEVINRLVLCVTSWVRPYQALTTKTTSGLVI